MTVAPRAAAEWLSKVCAGSDMGAMVEGYDWASTPLGPPGSWSVGLRTAVGVCLTSRFPLMLVWGPQRLMIYNDGYRRMLGTQKHPQALGARGEHARGARVDLDEVVGVERQPLAVDVDRARAAQRDVELLLARLALVVGLRRVVGRQVHDVGPERGDVEARAHELREPVPQGRQLVDGLR